MAITKWLHADVQDGGTDVIQAATSVQLIAIKGTTNPSDRAAAIGASYALALKTSGVTFTGQTGAAGAARVLTVDAQAGISITASGDMTGVAIVDGSRLLAVTSVSTQTLTSGGTVDIAAWTITINQPS